ncbi:MAG: hydroxymethylglutaryl-CoA reductase, degradative [Deltaproteobacteria bacterium]|nr:hydroxymethylglutaryl-CoA reductase, degradative [Deltaproteobacteria bacterium]
MKTNSWEGFSKLSLQERKRRLVDEGILSKEDCDDLQSGALDSTFADHLVENVIGVYSLPFSVAPHFLIDGKSYIVPLVTEESSVVAALSFAAKLLAHNGGFQTQILGNMSIGQIQFPIVEDQQSFEEKILKEKHNLIEKSHSFVPNLTARGGGVRDILIRFLKRPDQKKMAVLHVLCDTKDAMGANLINQICEHLKPELERLTQEKVGICILSNLVDTKLVEATCDLAIEASLASSIEEAHLFAQLDPYRAVTHNKGIMNGIDALLVATGNDFRAVEAGAHAYASLKGQYTALTSWTYKNDKLHGKLILPIACGTVGGMTKAHPLAKLSLKILNIKTSQELTRICAAVGLAQNFSALRALCQEGIAQGHMKLHASNLALAAGATNENEIQCVRDKLQYSPLKTVEQAKKILDQFRKVKRHVVGCHCEICETKHGNLEFMRAEGSNSINS